MKITNNIEEWKVLKNSTHTFICEMTPLKFSMLGREGVNEHTLNIAEIICGIKSQISMVTES
jgi:hypothetical protein